MPAAFSSRVRWTRHTECKLELPGPAGGKKNREICSANGTATKMSTKVIVGISGASGAVYGWRLLQRLRAHGGVEIHLILTLSLIHISEPTRLGMISYAVFCLKKKKN